MPLVACEPPAPLTAGWIGRLHFIHGAIAAASRLPAPRQTAGAEKPTGISTGRPFGSSLCRERIAHFHHWDRVASGRCRPEAPTDPYVLALEHTVHQIRGSLRTVELNGRSSRAPANSAGACVGIDPRAFRVAGCGGEATCASIAQLPGGSLTRLPNSP